MSEQESKQITDNELKQMLIKIAKADMADGTSIYDHPCSVAIRRMEEGAYKPVDHARSLARYLESNIGSIYSCLRDDLADFIRDNEEER